MSEWKTFRVVPVCCLLCLLMACATVPLTGRRQLALIPSSQLLTMSVDSYQQVLRESTLSDNQERVGMVRRVGVRLADAAETYLQANGYSTGEYQWEFNVIKGDDTVNAWCMPGGKVAVYTGILPVAQDDDGLAVVMGHEIAHAIANHGNERMSEQLLVELGGVALSVALEEQPQRTKDLFMVSYGAGSQLGFVLPHSRGHEAEADRIGLTLMAMAGYDPRAAIPFWQRMNSMGGARPPEFLSTHPAPQSRIEKLRSYLPEAMAHYRAP